MLPRRAVSEFPNDNPDLHDGLVWACSAPLGRALPHLRLRPIAGSLPRVLGPDWEARAEAVSRAVSVVGEPDAEPNHADAEPNQADAEPNHADAEPNHAEMSPRSDAEPDRAETPPLDPAESDPVVVVAAAEPSAPFASFVAALAKVALARSATRAAAAVTALLEQGKLGLGALEPPACEALIARRVLTSSGTQLTVEFRAARDAWRGVLDGSVADLSACGAGTLDVWAAELLALCISTPNASVAELRRELRRAGVAAFGLLAVA